MDPEKAFNTQTILACDDNGEFQEYIPRALGHTGKGRRHLAITVLIYNSNGEVLLQRRKHKVFDDIWEMTGSTHQLHLENKDETDEEATQRCLEEEYGIPKGSINLKKIGAINYFAQWGHFCENEHDVILVGEYNGEIKHNSQAGYSYKWMDKKEFLDDIEKNPKEHAPWAVDAAKLLKEKGFFSE